MREQWLWRFPQVCQKTYLKVNANGSSDDGGGEDYEACTIWLNREFSGDVRVKFDAYVIANLEMYLGESHYVAYW